MNKTLNYNFKWYGDSVINPSSASRSIGMSVSVETSFGAQMDALGGNIKDMSAWFQKHFIKAQKDNWKQFKISFIIPTFIHPIQIANTLKHKYIIMELVAHNLLKDTFTIEDNSDAAVYTYHVFC